MILTLTDCSKKVFMNTPYPFSDRQQKQAYENQNKLCAHCHKHFALKDMDGHHKIAYADGGETTIANCEMLCKDCHKDYHAENN